MDLNRRLPHIDTTRFAMVPSSEIPRSTFFTTHSLKSTFNAGLLIPIHVDEVLPADVHQGEVTIFARLATPVFPLMDNLKLETFFFWVPNRLVWANWRKMMGERKNPSDSISYIVPVTTANPGGWAVASIFDYFGLPTLGQLDVGATPTYNVLPLRAYNLIWNEWFRDENLQNSVTENTGDGPDTWTDYNLKKRNKRHDYFTSALPWPLKGGAEATLGLSGMAQVKGIAFSTATTPTAGGTGGTETGGGSSGSWPSFYRGNDANAVLFRGTSTAAGTPPQIFADLSTAIGQTINGLRLAVQTQRLLERDARGGTRYTELLHAHFGVYPEDMRLQRPEYIGGGTTTFQTQAIPYTAQDRKSSDNTINNPVGQLGATALAADQHSFTLRATEHGYIIGLACVSAELTYQQGVHRMWTRSTRYDFYWPAFAHLGEQAIRVDEIYVRGTAQDRDVWGYQERWSEYRHYPSRITGNFKSTSTGNIDEWHLAEQFGSVPSLNSTFIEDPTATVLTRILSAGAQADKMQVLFDSVFRIKRTRALPMFSVPGMLDRF